MDKNIIDQFQKHVTVDTEDFVHPVVQQVYFAPTRWKSILDSKYTHITHKIT